MSIPAMNYTMLPNAVIDAMPSLSGSELKVILAVCRETIGYHRTACRLTVAALRELTGLSKQSVITAAAKMVARCWLRRESDGDSFTYSLDVEKRSKNLTDQSREGSKNLTGGGQKIRPEGVKKIDPSINKGFKEKSLNKAPAAVENRADVCVFDDEHPQKQEQIGPPQASELTIAGSYQGWDSAPPAADPVQQFIDTYNSAKPSTWAIAINHSGRLHLLRQLAASVGGLAQAQALLKLALAHLHLNPDWLVNPSKHNGQQLKSRNLDHLLRTPKLGGVPYMLTYAEASQTAGVDADRLLDAVIAGLDVQAARREFEYVASGQAEEDARRAAEVEQQQRDRDDEFERARQQLDAERRRGRATVAA